MEFAAPLMPYASGAKDNLGDMGKLGPFPFLWGKPGHRLHMVSSNLLAREDLLDIQGSCPCSSTPSSLLLLNRRGPPSSVPALVLGLLNLLPAHFGPRPPSVWAAHPPKASRCSLSQHSSAGWHHPDGSCSTPRGTAGLQSHPHQPP